MTDKPKHTAKKESVLSEATKTAIRDRISQGTRDNYQIAAELVCSPSQVAGIQATMKAAGQ
jgi:hypothetical protein